MTSRQNPKCRHCGREIVRCEELGDHAGCSSAFGYIHYFTGAHACQPRSDGPYAQPRTGARR